MKRRIAPGSLAPACVAAALLVATSGTAIAQPFAQGDWTGHINLLIGQKFLGGDDWGPVDEQIAAGLAIDFGHVTWPVNIAIDIIGSDDEEDSLVPGVGRVVRVSAEISELNLGVRKFWERNPFFQPYVGGGIALVTAEIQSLGVEEEADGVGVWGSAGITLALSAHFNLGAEVRYSWAEVDLAGDKRQAGGFTAGALVGYRW